MPIKEAKMILMRNEIGQRKVFAYRNLNAGWDDSTHHSRSLV